MTTFDQYLLALQTATSDWNEQMKNVALKAEADGKLDKTQIEYILECLNRAARRCENLTSKK